ncbi:hypothetical protein Gpo141_00001577 [Globisporangium polare]
MTIAVVPAEATHEPTSDPSHQQQKKSVAARHGHLELRRGTAAVTADRIVSVALPKFQFLCVWVLVLATRAVCVSFLLTLSLMYSVLSTTELDYYTRLLTTRCCLYRPVSWLAACGGAANMYQICRILYYTFKAKRPTFESNKHSSATITTDQESATPWLASATRLSLWCSKTAIVKRLRFELFGRQGFFGVESPYFELRFLVREFVEMLSQSMQVYTASTLIAKQWINHLYVAIVFINSFSTPLVKHFTHHTPALERLMCLATDLFLDIVTSIVVPLIIAVPYTEVFDTTTFSFPTANLYNPSWFIKLVMENRQVFVRNELDMVLKVAPHMSIYGCLGSIQSLVRQKMAKSSKPNERMMQRKIHPDAATQPRPQEASRSKGPVLPEAVSKKSMSRTDTHRRRLSIRVRHMQRHKLQGHKATAVHVAFILWGCAIVAFHLTAIFSSYGRKLCGCNLQLYPWFTEKCACSVFEYNCYRQGTTSPTEESLASLDMKTLAVLIFSHCPALVVPKYITRFHMLSGIEIWNSSIVSWTREAGVTAQRHPIMTYICLVKVQMTGIPEGLLYDLPTQLQDIEITRTNLTWLPEDLDVRWQAVKTIYFEYAQLNTWSPVLSRLNAADFSLIGNNISQLPTLTAGGDGATDGYFTFSLSNNPITKLPNYTGDLTDLYFLGLENTELLELPKWVDTIVQHGHKVYMHGTPFCDAKSPAEIEARYSANAALTCVSTNARVMGRYPYELVRGQQQP